MPDWSPELVVDEALARRLIGARFPELRVATMRLLGEGWDSTAWLVDGEWVFRFPRREVVFPGFRRELAGAAPARAGAAAARAGRGAPGGAERGVRLAVGRVAVPARP